MFPVLFEIPSIPAWWVAALLAGIAAVFVRFALKDREDSGSWWMAGAFGVGAVWLLVKFGLPGEGPKVDDVLPGHLPSFPIRLFGLLVVGGFLAGMKVVQWRNARRGLLEPDQSFDLAFWVLLIGIAGSRMLHVVQHAEDFNGQPGRIFALWDGGLVWYGGALSATLYAWWWLARRDRNIWAVCDSLALGVALAQAIGRLGCFAAGCDYGRIVEGGREAVPWAVNFPDHPLTLVPESFRVALDGSPIWVHPAQLYLVLSNLAIFGLLLLADRREGRGAFTGRLAALYLMLYAVGRGVVEHWRGDADRGVYDLGFAQLSFSQVVSIGVFIAGVFLWRIRAKRAAPTPPPTSPTPADA